MRGRQLVTALALLALSAGSLFAQQAKSPTKGADDDVAQLSRAGEARAIGPDTAHVIVLEFLDYACPVCASFHTQRADSLRRAVGPDVRIVYVNFPLAQHMRSFHGSEAATCAAGIGGSAAYLAMADRLYRRQSEWTEQSDPGPIFAKFAKEALIDSVQFADCRARDEMAPLILADLDNANKFSIDGTPTFIVIPRGAQSAGEAGRTSGNVPISQLMTLIAQARAKAK